MQFFKLAVLTGFPLLIQITLRRLSETPMVTFNKLWILCFSFLFWGSYLFLTFNLCSFEKKFLYYIIKVLFLFNLRVLPVIYLHLRIYFVNNSPMIKGINQFKVPSCFKYQLCIHVLKVIFWCSNNNQSCWIYICKILLSYLKKSTILLS